VKLKPDGKALRSLGRAYRIKEPEKFPVRKGQSIPDKRYLSRIFAPYLDFQKRVD